MYAQAQQEAPAQDAGHAGGEKQATDVEEADFEIVDEDEQKND